MKPKGTFFVTVLASIIGAMMMFGCTAALRAIKSEPQAGADQSAGKATQAQTSKPSGPDAPPKKGDSAPPRVAPKYDPPPPPPGETVAEGALDLREKDEINASALQFAKNVKGVKHVKTCYSKLYGGWYLLLYVEKKKKMALHQYSWNDKSKEWEVIYYLKEIPEDQIEHHLKGEVADEKCFVLK